MSWIGGSLSQITGQISNFTKEVLTEGTEEIDDHATELRVAKSKLGELSAQYTAQRSEIERLKAINHELSDKLESTELQRNAIASEYRGQLAEKEEEIKQLKHKQHELLDLQKKMLASPLSHSTSAPSLTILDAGYGSDDMDFNDVIASQHEINRLRVEVQRLEAECMHWREVAAASSASSSALSASDKRSLTTSREGADGRGGSEDVNCLQTEIRELRESLSEEIDQHQRELAALQDVHSQKLATLKKRHKQEVLDLEAKVADLEDQNKSHASSVAGRDDAVSSQDERKGLRERLVELDKVKVRLEADLEHARHDCTQKDRTLQNLAKQLRALQSEKNKLGNEKQDLEKEVSALGQERGQLKAELNAANQRLVNEVKKADHQEEVVQQLTTRLQDAERERAELRTEAAQQAQLKTSVKDLELEARLASTEASVVLDDMGNTEHQKLTANIVNSLEKENHVLKQNSMLMEKRVKELEKSMSIVEVEKCKQQQTIEDMDRHIQALGGLSHSEAEKMAPQPMEDDIEVLGLGKHRQSGSTMTSTPVRPRHKLSLSSMSEASAASSDQSTATASTSGGSFISKYSEISLRNQELDDQVRTLQSQIKKYEQEINHFEYVKADWQMEKEALEEVLMKLREELREKETSLTLVQAQKGLAEVQQQEKHDRDTAQDSNSTSEAREIHHHTALLDHFGVEEEEDEEEDEEMEGAGSPDGSDIDANIDYLNTQVELLTAGNEKLEKDLDTISVEKETLVQDYEDLEERNEALEKELQELRRAVKDDETGQLADQLKAKEAELKALSDRLHEQLKEKEAELLQLSDRHQELLKAKEVELLDVSCERDQLVGSLEELDAQQQIAMAKVIQVRDSLLRNNEELKGRVALLESQVTEAEVEKNLLKSEKDALNLSFEQERGKTAAMAEQHRELESQQGAETDTAIKERNHLLEELDTTREELMTSSDTVKKLTSEKQAYLVELEDLQSKVKSGALALNDLHMDKQELEKHVSAMKRELSELQASRKALSAEKGELEQRLNDTEEELQGLKEETSLSLVGGPSAALEEQLSILKVELDQSQQASEDHQSKIAEMERQMEALENRLTCVSADKEELLIKLQEVERSASVQSGRLDTDELASSATTQIDSLKSERHSLEKEVEFLEGKLQEQKKHYENYIKDMGDAKDMDSGTLQVDHDRLRKQIYEKDRELNQLKSMLEQVQQEMEDNQDVVQSSIDNQKQLTDLINEKESDIYTLKRENAALLEENREVSSQVRSQEAQLAMLMEADQKARKYQVENGRYLNELESLRSQLDSQKIESKTLDVITDLESEITSLNTEIEVQSNEIKSLQETIKDNESKASNLNDEIAEINKKLRESNDVVNTQKASLAVLERKLEGLTEEIKAGKSALNEERAKLEQSEQALQATERDAIQQLSELGAQLEYFQAENAELRTRENSGAQESENLGDLKRQVEEQQGKISKLETENQSLRHAQQNGVVPSDDDDDEEDGEEEKERDESSAIRMETLQKVLSQKDSVISELKDNNASLLKMLEERSMTIYGDRTLMELQELQAHVRSLQMEKEQIMSVLNEKSRECSNLKGEVHRLMNVVSAEKSAISKLQQDNHELTKKREDKNSDMQKQALQNLSRIIRDKDLEIEALQQKNGTLLTVLQESSQSGNEINGLMQERENLSKQVAVFQQDREQIIVLLNQKHQESITYHAEIQRLNGALAGSSESKDKLEQEYYKLQSQFEEKQKTLLNVQNDLISFKQKYADLEVGYQDLLEKESSSSSTVDSSVYEERNNQVSQLSEKIRLQQDALAEKDRSITEATSNLHRTEKILMSKEVELNTLRKQLENITFQLQGLRSELEDFQKDKAKLSEQCTNQLAEMASLKESGERLTMSLRDKEFEVNALREKTATLTAMVQEGGAAGGNKAEMEQLMRESEAMQGQAQKFQQERDQVLLELQHRQTENADLQLQMHSLKEKEAKHLRELSRLREHLLQIEEGYTREALESEEREKELRNRLAVAEERAATSSSAIQNASLQASHQVESLGQQLHAVASQRDGALLQLAATQEQAQQYATQLNNLQMVLEQFTIEKETQQAAELERYQQLLQQSREEAAGAKNQVVELDAQLREAIDALDAANRLSEQLDRKEEAMQALKEEVLLREKALTESEDEVQRLRHSTAEKVDKIIMKNLFLGYFSAPTNQRTEVVRLIGGVLDFSHDDMEKVGVEGHNTGWLSGIVNRIPGVGAKTPTTSRSRSAIDKSFSELFVKFLETESTPKMTMRLPAEEMAREEIAKAQQHKQQRPAFNPFSAPRHAALPLRVGVDGGATRGEQHLLMQPVSPTILNPAMNIFAPVPTAAESVAREASESGRSTGTSDSGRSTPNTSSILKGVLQGPS